MCACSAPLLDSTVRRFAWRQAESEVLPATGRATLTEEVPPGDSSPMEQQIVVGYDQTDRAQVALAWAVDEARLRDADLVVCHAWDVPYASVDHEVAQAARSFAKSTLDEGIVLARQGLPHHRVRPLLAQGSAGLVLARESRTAALMVIGTRGPGRLARLRLDSVSAHVVARARCPVTIVRGQQFPAAPDEPTLVVVAVDQSADATTALGLAFEEAAWLRSDLHAWCGVWEYGPLIGGPSSAPGADPERRWLEETVPQWREKFPEVPQGRILGHPRGVVDAELGGRRRTGH